MSTIKELREKANLTQDELAYKAGINSSTISNMETGKPVRKLMVNLVCDALGVSSNDVTGVVYASRYRNHNVEEKK